MPPEQGCCQCRHAFVSKYDTRTGSSVQRQPFLLSKNNYLTMQLPVRANGLSFIAHTYVHLEQRCKKEETKQVRLQDNIRGFALQWWSLCHLPGQQVLSISKNLCSYHLPWVCFCACLARLMQPVQLHSLHRGLTLLQPGEAMYSFIHLFIACFPIRR